MKLTLCVGIGREFYKKTFKFLLKQNKIELYSVFIKKILKKDLIEHSYK